MNKDIFKIFEYISQQAPLCLISVDTNGSIRDEDFWWDIGCMLDKQLSVVFAIDGVDQKMHEKYRRFTDLDKVLNNMSVLSNTNAVVQSQTILFQHNEDYKDQILELVKDYGSNNHEFVISDRFDGGNTQHFIDDNGDDFTLTRANSKSLPNGIISGAYKQETIPVKTFDKQAQSPKTKVVSKQQRTLEHNIKCRWALPRNEVVVNPDGQVLPCCFHANHIYGSRPTNAIENDPAYRYYLENKNEFNVFKTSIIDIMKSEHFTKTLPESIEGNNPNRSCVKQCSNRIKKEHQLRERHGARLE